MDDTQFLNLLRDSRALTSASDIGSALEALGTLYADQVRGVPLFEIRQVFSVAELFEAEWEEGIQSGTIYFEKIRLKTLAR